jgi:lysophosphatidate acyltransferase
MLNLPYYLQSLRWVAPAGFMLGTAPAYYALWGGWRVISSVLPSRVFEAGDEVLYSLYQRLVLFFFENCSGVEVVLYGDTDKILERPENVILISNHQCTVDWMIADMLAVRQGSLGNIRYILKDGLKYLPLYGYYFRQHSCVYVKRSGKFDQSKAERQLDMFTNNHTPFWMVVFPEGTRFNPDLPDVIAKCQNYAREEGLPIFDQLLTPRLKALQLCVERLRPSADAVYDITIAYSSTLCPQDKLRRVGPSLSEFLQGNCKQVHIHVKRIPICDVPTNDKLFCSWLMDRFMAKDRLLQEFYCTNHGTFGEDSRISPLPLTSTVPSVVFFAALNAPFWLTETGRAAWWRLTALGTLVCWAWVTVRS